VFELIIRLFVVKYHLISFFILEKYLRKKNILYSVYILFIQTFEINKKSYIFILKVEEFNDSDFFSLGSKLNIDPRH